MYERQTPLVSHRDYVSSLESLLLRILAEHSTDTLP